MGDVSFLIHRGVSDKPHWTQEGSSNHYLVLHIIMNGMIRKGKRHRFILKGRLIWSNRVRLPLYFLPIIPDIWIGGYRGCGVLTSMHKNTGGGGIVSCQILQAYIWW